MMGWRAVVAGKRSQALWSLGPTFTVTGKNRGSDSGAKPYGISGVKQTDLELSYTRWCKEREQTLPQITGLGLSERTLCSALLSGASAETSSAVLQRAVLQFRIWGGGWEKEWRGGRMLTIGFNNGCDGVSAATARLQLPPTALDHNVLFLLWSSSHGCQCVNAVGNNEEKSRVTDMWMVQVEKMLRRMYDRLVDTTTPTTTTGSEHRL